MTKQTGLYGIGAALLFVLLALWFGFRTGAGEAEWSRVKAPDPEHTWIVQWKGEPDPAFSVESEIRSYYPSSRTMVARPKDPDDLTDWVKKWSKNPGIASFEPNQKVRISKSPNDPLLSNQSYLQQIHAEAAWDVATESDGMTIAVVDTGVDLDHPDLKDNLTEGINLIHPGTPPKDDNGHGTGVAGVIAAMADNDAGTAGLLWKARIMPVKALETDGNGDEDKLGEGIRYAVDHGAKVVVLSLGLNKYSTYMKNVVQYAEDQGVLLVAASGNEGGAVKYPAAYETVLAVGGVDSNNAPEKLSNYGPELDLMAPWVVFTTALGGSYEYRDGTSMAAPQAASVAALAWSRHPELTPAQIRSLLRQTSQDLGAKGWDSKTGYGLLRADRALQEVPRPDMYEPNDRQATSAPVSVNKRLSAVLNPGDEDWYLLETPYDGSLRFKLYGSGTDAVKLSVVSEATNKELTVETGLTSEEGASLDLKKGRYYARLSAPSAESPIEYDMAVGFRVYRDAFEDNDRQYKAYMLPSRSQLAVGTFHQLQDQDWYSMQIDQPGKLSLKATPDTARMDLVLTLQRKGGEAVLIDRSGDGQSEFYEADVKPGLYYIKINNIVTNTYPVIGEYVLDIDLATSYKDPYEPNDKPYQATTLTFGENDYGMVEQESDADWFRLRLEGSSLLRLELDPAPSRSGLQMQLYDSALRSLDLAAEREDVNRWAAEAVLPAGTYYVKLSASGSAKRLFYGLKATADRLVEGYRDLYGHWAEKEIVTLIQDGKVDGYGGNRLNPDSPITRGEAVTLLDKTLLLPSAPPPPFSDVSSDYWAYNAVARAAAAGIVNGYADLTFAPDRSISRMEMAAMLAHATRRKGIAGDPVSFGDVDQHYWGEPILSQLKAEGWIEGYGDGTFRPERVATRAEFMKLAVRMLGL